MQQPCNVIHLDPEIQASFSRNYSSSTVSLSANNTYLEFFDPRSKLHRLVKPTCSYCGVYYNRSTFEYNWKICQNLNHFYCYCCFEYSSERYNSICSDGHDIFSLLQIPTQRTMKDMFHREMLVVLKSTLYECKWPNCENFVYGVRLKEHEISCEFQPARECPVDGCTWKGRLNEMHVEHFNKYHPNRELSFKNVVLPKSPTMNDYYMLILDKFVLIQYEVKQLGQVHIHTITLKVCKDELSCAQPMAVVSHESNKTYALLGNIQGHGVVKSIRSEIALLVYFQQTEP